MEKNNIKLSLLIGALFLFISIINPMVFGLELRIENPEVPEIRNESKNTSIVETEIEEPETPNPTPLLIDPLQYIDSLTEKLHNPSSVTTLPNGDVLVTDLTHDHIARFQANGTFIGTWEIPEGPIGLAVHPNGKYYIALRDEATVGIYTYDSVNDILVRSEPGSLGEGNPLVSFVQPTDIDIATDTGRIYVVDSRDDKIYGFEADGTLALTFGEHGPGDEQFYYPSAIVVDETSDHLIIGDQDNFRVKIFDTSGVFIKKFGYRIKFMSGGSQEGWTVRTQGLAVDTFGNIYVGDAIMSTVRIFDASGVELDKVLEYGLSPGGIQVPFGIALSANGSYLYVVSTGTSSVEIFETPIIARQSSIDNTDSGTDFSEFDVNGAENEPLSYEGLHFPDSADMCGRCHSITGQPGIHPGTLEGQVVLCMSCHSGGGQALNKPVMNRDIADPFGTNPSALDGQGRSHAWGVSAVNEEAHSIGPSPGSQMEYYLDVDGNMKCSTCHDPHSVVYSPYLRVNNNGDAMCKECHAPLDLGPGEGDSHPVGFDYPGGSGEYPPDGEIAPPLLLKAGRVECMTCHAPHNADSGGANDNEGDGMLIRVSNDETLCLICHTNHG